MTVSAPTATQPGPAVPSEVRNPYALLNIALAKLKQDSVNDEARLSAIREYLTLHLVLPAKELLDQWSPDGIDHAAVQPLRDVIRKLHGGPILWSARQRRFEANLCALRQRGVAVGSIQESWRAAADRHQAFCDVNGQIQARRLTPAGQWEWLPALGPFTAEEQRRALPDDIKSIMPGPYLFDGIGVGHYFERVYKATVNTFLGYSCALYVLEPDTARLALQLHLHDWTTILADDRVFLFHGLDCKEQLLAAWNSNFDLPWPTRVFSAPRSGAASGAVEFVQKSGLAREHQIRESLAQLNQQYVHCDLAHWSRRFAEAASSQGAARPLRILSAVSTHTTFLQHSMRDARRALESLGHEVRVLTEEKPFTIIGPLTYHQAIREFEPDLFLLLDHLRPECAAVIPENLPILTWDQDLLPHVFTPQNLARIGRNDFIAGGSKYHCVTLGCNPEQLLNARIPTCPEQFSGPDLSDDERSRYECDVSYVSHAAQTPKAFHDEERSQYSDSKTKQLLDTMFELLPGQIARYRVADGGVMKSVLDEACRVCGVAEITEALRARLCGWYLWRLGDRLFRHEALEWVADWAGASGRSFRIYGNGWEKHPSLSSFAAGPAQNGRELLCVYRASRINLQLMPAGFVHQRSLDGLAAGGFFLTRLVPDDLRGRTLRKLVARIDSLSIRTTQELLAHADTELRRLLGTFAGDRISTIHESQKELLAYLRASSELTYPDEVFTDLQTIQFDSAAQFRELAEAFLADRQRRNEVAARMRDAVIRHYSYQPTMKSFLDSMTRYLHIAQNRDIAKK